MNTNQEPTEHGRDQTTSHALRLDARQPNRHESVHESLLPTQTSARHGKAARTPRPVPTKNWTELSFLAAADISSPPRTVGKIQVTRRRRPERWAAWPNDPAFQGRKVFLLSFRISLIKPVLSKSKNKYFQFSEKRKAARLYFSLKIISIFK